MNNPFDNTVDDISRERNLEREYRLEYIIRFLVPKRRRFVGPSTMERAKEYFSKNPMELCIHRLPNGGFRESVKFDGCKKEYFLDFDFDLGVTAEYCKWRFLAANKFRAAYE